ncbi:MaoC/PaaZ C-terminal domain-containing protein [Arthrobacter sp. ISL-5]|uniref:MaoC/PaaZ C-terminal domain-containing protein n=1 Tax=Arthrobacter sp. ISL-5 TaxID=2819111 RepID=UPI001BEC603F|nr:MaoC/PaaZ C-terminal domain-containing protein [Arthrobacter sp. ISL-5]MBT2554154.1 MaoC family dehydratase N-terminal domain-containing protein [Arthrobacter sp. ISL-5]
MTELAVTTPTSTGMYFDDFQVGQNWITPKRTITNAEVTLFAGISGDFNPLHIDEEYAKTTQFGGRIFHGPGVFAIATGLESTLGLKAETAIAFLGMTWNMRAPVLIGDTIHVEQTVAELRPSRSKHDRGIIVFDVKVLNQRGQVCQEGQWNVMFKRK